MIENRNDGPTCIASSIKGGLCTSWRQVTYQQRVKGMMGSGDANSVREWLVQSGLRHHTAAFAGVTEVQFMGLMMQVSTCPSQAA